MSLRANEDHSILIGWWCQYARGGTSNRANCVRGSVHPPFLRQAVPVIYSLRFLFLLVILRIYSRFASDSISIDTCIILRVNDVWSDRDVNVTILNVPSEVGLTSLVSRQQHPLYLQLLQAHVCCHGGCVRADPAMTQDLLPSSTDSFHCTCIWSIAFLNMCSSGLIFSLKYRNMFLTCLTSFF